MILSMTGFGRGEATKNSTTATSEVRSVNSRYLEVTTRLPRTVVLRENDIKELIRTKFVRGKINITVSIISENGGGSPLRVNKGAAKLYYSLLNDLRKVVKIQEKISLTHLLQFPDVLEINGLDKGAESEWTLVKKSLINALDEAFKMRELEGNELSKDLRQRIKSIESRIVKIEKLSGERVPEARSRLEERLRELLSDQSVIDERRLEMEIALMADKLDVTEECVRFRSHNKFFLSALNDAESPGRKLNFLTQEMNREANTMGAKADDSAISHLVVEIKEELEKIREQLQNIE
jgi:uncharacterized protein (TIGR00255 family)